MGLSRRELLAKGIQACALTCIASCHAFGMPDPVKNKFQNHTFDTEMEGRMTYRQVFHRQYYNINKFCKALKKEGYSYLNELIGLVSAALMAW